MFQKTNSSHSKNSIDLNVVWNLEEPPVDEIYEKVMNSGIYEKGLEQGLELGREEGREQGEFKMALKIKKSIWNRRSY